MQTISISNLSDSVKQDIKQWISSRHDKAIFIPFTSKAEELTSKSTEINRLENALESVLLDENIDDRDLFMVAYVISKVKEGV